MVVVVGVSAGQDVVKWDEDEVVEGETVEEVWDVDDVKDSEEELEESLEPIKQPEVKTMITKARAMSLSLTLSPIKPLPRPQKCCGQILKGKDKGKTVVEMSKVKITGEPFSVDEAIKLVERDEAGGYVVFLGKVRNENMGRRVLKLIYEAYEEMALKEMEKIRKEALEKFPILDMLIWHRVGELKVGEDTILIVASAKHRSEAFDACRWAIDEVKKRVPVWKKEVTEEGTFWIEGEQTIPEDYHKA